MPKLTNFSIETDHTVLLQFNDGRELRVPLTRIKEHLGANDLNRISAAVQLRRNFIRNHMPKVSVVVIVAAASLATLLATTSTRALTLLLPRATVLEALPAHDQQPRLELPRPNPGIGGIAGHNTADTPALAAIAATPLPVPTTRSGRTIPLQAVKVTPHPTVLPSAIPQTITGLLDQLQLVETPAPSPEPDRPASTATPVPTIEPRVEATPSPAPIPPDELETD